MSESFDSERLEFECPKCGNKIVESIGRLKRENYACSGCGQEFDTKELKELHRQINKAERQLREFEKKLKNGIKF